MEFLSTTISNLLHHFNSQTIQRSLGYVKQIDENTLQIVDTAGTIELSGDVTGTHTYHTNIIFNKKNRRITSSHCSCPVGNFCKHGAALGRRLLKDLKADEMAYIQTISQASPEDLKSILDKNTTTVQNAVNNHSLSFGQNKITSEEQAILWLGNLREALQKTHQAFSTKKPAIIYLVKQKFDELRLYPITVKRLKSGEIKDYKTIKNIQQMMYWDMNIPREEEAIFKEVFHYAKNKYYHHQDYLLGNDLPIATLKTLTKNQMLFMQGEWQQSWQTEQHHPIAWTDEILTLNMMWSMNEPQQGERLIFELVDDHHIRHKFGQNEALELILTKPVAFMNKQTRQIGAVNASSVGDMPSDVLYRLLTMPSIPKDLATEVEEVFLASPVTEQLPKPKNITPIEAIYGLPRPIIRFGSAEDISLPWRRVKQEWQGQWMTLEFVKAQLYFAYEAGEIEAGGKEVYFGVRAEGKRIHQYRDIKAEQKAIRALRKVLPSMAWIKTVSGLSKHEATIELGEALSALLPTDKLREIGWQVQHLIDSPLDMKSAKGIELELKESANQDDIQGNEWFEIGASISDEHGYRYDLLDIIASLLKKYPYLLHDDVAKLFDEGHQFAIEVNEGQARFAIAFGEILPILQNLGHLLSQDERKIDRYDAHTLLEMQHSLGMVWQGGDKLLAFAEILKQGYQSSLPTPSDFVGELRGYQQQGLAWLQFLTKTGHGGILADDMGLGKTAQTLAHILMEQQAGHLTDKPVLIVAPTSLMYNWQKEVQKFAPTLSMLLLHGANRHDDFDKISEYDIVLTTYPLVVRDEAVLKNHAFHQIILDEAQNIKNPRSKSAQVLRSLTATHRLCLTGTPMENHLGELWSLFYFLMPGFLASQEVFNKQYRHPIEKKGDGKKRDRLVNRIKPFVLRRLKTEVAKELPPKTVIEMNIEMNDEQSKLYEAVRATMQHTIKQIIAEQGFKRSQIQILDALLKLRQVCCHPSLLNLDTLPTSKKPAKSAKLTSAKLDYLVEMVVDMLAEGRKMLIFSQFTSMLALIEARLDEKRIAFSKLTGRTKKRDEAIEAFQSGQVSVFLISLKAGGVGLNLTAADTVIHYDPWWNPATEDQASDRAWRIGQDKPVFVYKLITSQSIEEKILTMQKNKAALTSSILSTDHEDEVKLGEEELLGLFERFV